MAPFYVKEKGHIYYEAIHFMADKKALPLEMV